MDEQKIKNEAARGNIYVQVDGEIRLMPKPDCIVVGHVFIDGKPIDVGYPKIEAIMDFLGPKEAERQIRAILGPRFSLSDLFNPKNKER